MREKREWIEKLPIKRISLALGALVGVYEAIQFVVLGWVCPSCVLGACALGAYGIISKEKEWQNVKKEGIIGKSNK